MTFFKTPKQLLSILLLAGLGFVILLGITLYFWAKVNQVLEVSHQQPPDPEPFSGFYPKKMVYANRMMAVTAHPLATQAAYNILKQGGNALDAAIAAQMVLNLVEPQSSGLGGGAFLLFYDAAHQKIEAYDGRETAPLTASPNRFLDHNQPLERKKAINSGLSVGTPGLLKMLALTHERHGQLPWKTLFLPAIHLAQNGFPVSHRLHVTIEIEKAALWAQPKTRAYFLTPQGQPLPVGFQLRNPELAKTFEIVAAKGIEPFYQGKIAQDMVEAVKNHSIPGDLSEADLAAYQAKLRKPVCGIYRDYQICGMPPPSSGGISLLQILGELEPYPMQQFDPNSTKAVHYFSEAGRLAYADRDVYIADPDFEKVPVNALLNPTYLRARGALIHPEQSLGTATAGDPVGWLKQRGKDDALEIKSTSALVILDAQGNAVSMTTSVESAFGSKIWVDGFLLNNQLTDFSFSPKDPQGRWVANRVEPGKRPRSAMAPTFVFSQGKLFMVVGSAGGSMIINYVAKTLMGVLDWGLDIQQAIALPNRGSVNQNGETLLEKNSVLENIAPELLSLHHKLLIRNLPSGTQGIVIQAHQLSGGADPHREGNAMGE